MEYVIALWERRLRFAHPACVVRTLVASASNVDERLIEHTDSEVLIKEEHALL